MPAQCTSGPARILDHGEVTTFFGHGLTLAVDLDGGGLVVHVTFAPADGPPRVDTERTADGLRLVLRGLDDTPGKGSATPVLLGEHGDTLVFLHFRVFRWGRSDDRTVHYTFFAAPKGEVGWQPTPTEDSR